MEHSTDALSDLSLSYDDKSMQLIRDIIADETIRRVGDYISILDIIKYITLKEGIVVIFDERWTTNVLCADAFDQTLDI